MKIHAIPIIVFSALWKTKTFSVAPWMVWIYFKTEFILKLVISLPKNKFSLRKNHRRKYQMPTARFVLNLKVQLTVLSCEEGRDLICSIHSVGRKNIAIFVPLAFWKYTNAHSASNNSKDKTKSTGNNFKTSPNPLKTSSQSQLLKFSKNKNSCRKKFMYLEFSVLWALAKNRGERVRKSAPRGCLRWPRIPNRLPPEESWPNREPNSSKIWNLKFFSFGFRFF